MPQKNLCPNAVCGSDIVFLFNSLNTIIMGGRRILPGFITALLHPPIPLLKKEKTKKHFKSLFHFGCSDQWLVTVIAGWREWRVLRQAGCTWLCESVRPCFPGGWRHCRPATCRSVEWLGVQSRARSGWVFSFSPFSSCFRVPASTTDWDLITGNRMKKTRLQTIHGGSDFGTLEGIQMLRSPY